MRQPNDPQPHPSTDEIPAKPTQSRKDIWPRLSATGDLKNRKMSAICAVSSHLLGKTKRAKAALGKALEVDQRRT